MQIDKRQVMAGAKNVTVNSSSIGFFGLLTIVLIALKLMGYINIGWGWIAMVFFAPLFIFLAIMFAFGCVIVLGIIGCLIYEYVKKK